MKKQTNLLYIKSFLLTIGLLLSANVMAGEVIDRVENSTNAQKNVDTLDSSASTSSEITPADLKQSAKNSLEVKKTLNNPNAMLVEMAFNFKKGADSPKGYAEVAAKYCKAAKYGDADAQYALGWMYENGRGVAANEKIAAQLYTMAAEQGHEKAKASLTGLSNVKSESTLLTCLLPDPPQAPIVGNTTASVDGNEVNEHSGITPKTTALFKSQASILKIVKKLAPKYDIDENLAMAFIAVESNFNVQATSGKNAQGLMQLIPETAARFGVKDAYKAEDNIKGGLAYLRWLLAYFKGDVELVAAAYNAGEGAVLKYGGVPPYTETQLYVKKISGLYNNTTHPYKDNLVKSPIFKKKIKKTVG
ncbi:MAG: transglycosylase SLT domain-containing protein [Methylophilaceae bacterium]